MKTNISIRVKSKPLLHSHKLALLGLVFNTIFIPLLTLFNIPFATTIASAIDVILLFVLIVIYRDFRRTIFSFPIVTWFLLMNYHYLNAIVKNVPDIDIRVYFNNIILPVCAMIFTVYLIRNKQVWMSALEKIILLFLLQCILYILIAGRVDYSDRITVLGINPNILGHIAGICVMMIAIYSLAKKKLSIYIITVIFIAVAIVFYTYSRNSLMIIFFALFGYLMGIAYAYKNKWKKFLTIILIPIAIYFAYYIVINFTELGQRFETNSDFANSTNIYVTGTLWDEILGERIIYYILGFANFLNNPFSGIGLWNFANYNNHEYPLHSEYMVHLAEGGIIGAVLYLCFIIYIIILFRKYKNKNTPLYIQTLICFLTIIYLGITARIFAYQYFFVLYGIIIGILQQPNWIKHKLKKSKSNV